MNEKVDVSHVGSHCSYVDCKQLDFLPIQCPLCRLLFCKEHSKNTEHGCAIRDNLLTIEQVNSLDSPASFVCSIEKCKNRELTPITCDKCSEQFCLQHRLPGDHSCSSIEKKEANPYERLTTKEKVEKVTGKNLNFDKSSGRVGKRSGKTSSKVIEMKLKMKAKGEDSIPIDERIYFNVKINTQDAGVKELPLFFSREYSVGKIIDLIAKYCELKNENHISTAPKLRLYVTDEEYFASDIKLRTLLIDEASEVSNFGEICIKYVVS